MGSTVKVSSNNTEWIYPTNSTTADDLIWRVGSIQELLWSTTVSPISLVLYQHSEVDGWRCTPIIWNLTDTTSHSWNVTSVVPLDSGGSGGFHFDLVTATSAVDGDQFDFDGGLNGVNFEIINSSFTSSSSLLFSIITVPVIVPTTPASVVIPTSSPVTTTEAIITTSTPTNTLAASTGAAATSSTASSVAPSSSSNTKKDLAIGLGVGIPVFILLTALAAMWYVRTHTRRSRRAAAANRSHGNQYHQDGTQDGPMQSILVGDSKWRHEPRIAEAEDTSARHEYANERNVELSA